MAWYGVNIDSSRALWDIEYHRQSAMKLNTLIHNLDVCTVYCVAGCYICLANAQYITIQYILLEAQPHDSISIHHLQEVFYYVLLNYFTYLLHGAILLEKLTGLQLVKRFPAFYGTRMFITAFTSARHLSLS
jgi:hypothetical protein